MFKDIDDAIKHERKMAKEYKETADSWYAGGCSFAQAEGNVCLEFAKEHEQVIKWLEELKARREADRWISTKERIPEKDGVYLVTIQYVAKYEKGSPIHTIELLASYDTKYGQWSSPDNVIAWRNLPKPYESEDK